MQEQKRLTWEITNSSWLSLSAWNGSALVSKFKCRWFLVSQVCIHCLFSWSASDYDFTVARIFCGIWRKGVLRGWHLKWWKGGKGFLSVEMASFIHSSHALPLQRNGANFAGTRTKKERWEWSKILKEYQVVYSLQPLFS